MKSVQNKVLILLGTIAGIVFLPLISSYIRYNRTFPEEFFYFPPLQLHTEKAPFNIAVFIIISLFCLFISLLYIFPQWFGFKKVAAPPKKKKDPSIKYPLWFWIGVLLHVSSLIIMWGKFKEPAELVNWVLVPLFWSAIFILDGFVYIRNDGKSLIKTRPRTMIAIAVVSIFGWVAYEYLNFFVDENWYYPKGDLIEQEQFIVYSLLGSSALLTITFEWYTLLNTFPKLKVKYTQGPVVKAGKTFWTIVLIASMVSLFVISYFPNQLFFLIWLAPMLALLSALEVTGIWSPFRPIYESGNWGPVALICLSYFIQGFFYEGWNYFSAWEHGANTETYNAAYWVYSIPYVDVLHIFEMPALGFFGYMPFGLYSWLAWLVFAWLLDIDPANQDMNTL